MKKLLYILALFAGLMVMFLPPASADQINLTGYNLQPLDMVATNTISDVPKVSVYSKINKHTTNTASEDGPGFPDWIVYYAVLHQPQMACGSLLYDKTVYIPGVLPISMLSNINIDPGISKAYVRA